MYSKNIEFVDPGNYDLKIPASAQAVNTNKIYFLCLTSGGAITISLPKISTLPDYARGWGYHIYITDFENNAAINNITIVAPVGDSISGAASVIINNNGGVSELFISSYYSWGYLSGIGTGSGSILQSQFFSLIEDQADYVFDGTVTAWNPLGLNLIGKSVPVFSTDGIIKQPVVNYNWVSASGIISIIGKVYSDVVAGLCYQ